MLEINPGHETGFLLKVYGRTNKQNKSPHSTFNFLYEVMPLEQMYFHTKTHRESKNPAEQNYLKRKMIQPKFHRRFQCQQIQKEVNKKAKIKVLEGLWAVDETRNGHETQDGQPTRACLQDNIYIYLGCQIITTFLSD